MHLERYPHMRADTFKKYEFYSEGPQGRIKKEVYFHLFNFDTVPFYNLSFGDWNEETQRINNYSVSNNGDAEKVLATVAAIVVDFTSLFSEAIIFAEGSTMARTRLYQMGINKMWNEIEKMFHVYGDTGEKVEPFRKNSNYLGFWVERRKLIDLQEEITEYMRSSDKKTDKKPIRYNDIVDVKMRDCSTDPFIIRKNEAARKRVEKTGIPKDILRRRGLL